MVYPLRRGLVGRPCSNVAAWLACVLGRVMAYGRKPFQENSAMRTSDLIKRLAVLAAGGAFVFGAVAAQVQQGSRNGPPQDEQPSTGTPNTTLSGGQDDGTRNLDMAQIMAMQAAMSGSDRSKSSGKDDLPKFEDISKGYHKVVSTADGSGSLYNVWVRDKDGQMLAELPRGYERQRHFMAMTVASGDLWAGLQAGDRYFYWKRFDKRLAMIAPNLDTRSSGDSESKDSVKNIFTDRVLLDVPIVAIGPSGQPVIDLDDLLVGKATKFFGGNAAGLNSRLTTVKEAKAFPENIEIEVQGPVANGEIRTFHYSISIIKRDPTFHPRKADTRVGFFTTSYRDLGKFNNDEKWVRYINHWNLQKADPSLKMSPPKEPIVYYISHEVPVRYRRWVRDGVLKWNKAFEKVGISNAIEVYYQDKTTGANMDKDPEDRRYNFIRWLSNDVSTAIGPSRVNPETGQILDADVVLTDGWIRAFWYQYNKTLPDIAMEGMGPDAMAFLQEHPNWDPRIIMANPSDRAMMLQERALRGAQPFGGHALGMGDRSMMGDDEFDGLQGRVSQINGMCMASAGMAMDMAVAKMAWQTFGTVGVPEEELTNDQPADDDGDSEIPPAIIELLKKKMAAGELPDNLPPEILAMLESPAEQAAPKAEAQPEEPKADEKKADEKKSDESKKNDDVQMLDGIPEWYVGPMLSELVAHEVGHTLGLRHNFAGSSVYTLDEINSPEMKGKKPWSISVMDYNPHNINMGEGPIQGDYADIDIGPYDEWAIQYGYTPKDSDAAKIAMQSADPLHRYLTDEDTWGPDPYARRYDLSANPLDYAKSQVKLANELRSNLLDRFVKKGQSWAKARQGYLVTLSMQVRGNSMMANWLGGAYVYRDHKGDPDGRVPTQPVDAKMQRDALNFIIKNTFYDDTYGLTPEIISHMTVDKWFDAGGISQIAEDPTWPIHDRILGIQASTLTMLLNPVTLQRIFDNEFRTASSEDALTLPEVLDTITQAVWSEVDGTPSEKYTVRKPMISTLRCNLQREHLQRMIDLAMAGKRGGAVSKPISDLAMMTLRQLDKRIEGVLESPGVKNVDAYTLSHLTACKDRIDRVLEAQYISNADDMRASVTLPPIIFGQDQQK